MSSGYPRVRVEKVRSTHNRMSDLPQEGVTLERPPLVGHFFVLYLDESEMHPDGETIRTSRIQAVRPVRHNEFEIDTHNSTYRVLYLDELN